MTKIQMFKTKCFENSNIRILNLSFDSAQDGEPVEPFRISDFSASNFTVLDGILLVFPPIRTIILKKADFNLARQPLIVLYSDYLKRHLKEEI